jgi:hypothetical protein
LVILISPKSDTAIIAGRVHGVQQLVINRVLPSPFSIWMSLAR